MQVFVAGKNLSIGSLYKKETSVSKWGNKDTAAQTGCSTSQAAAAAHLARDDATKAGLLERGNSEKNSQRFSRSDESGQAATSFWGSIFGSSKK